MKSLDVNLGRETIIDGTWEEIVKLFECLKENKGDTQLNMYIDETDRDALIGRPYMFIVRKISPYYFPTKLIRGGGAWSYYNPNGIEEAGGERMIDGGDGYWDAMTMTLDYDLVLSMAKEFYETGDVALLDY